MNYIGIDKHILVENSKIGCDLYLKVHVNGTSRYVLFCHGSEQYGTVRKGELVERSIERLYIQAKDYEKFFKYQEENLPCILESIDLGPKEKSRAVYHVAKKLTKDILQNIGGTEIDIDRAKNWVKYTIGFILNDPGAFSSLLSMTSHDYYTYTHSINLSVIGLLFGKHLNLSSENLNSLGTGMLLHDAGKVLIPLEILNNPGKLTKHEFEIVKQHPEAGFKLLRDQNNMEEKFLIPAIRHHENYDGTGYPYGIGGDDIELNGRISRIVDVYDAITTKRCYAGAMSPFAALDEMREQMIHCIDKELFQEFIRLLGPADRGLLNKA